MQNIKVKYWYFVLFLKQKIIHHLDKQSVIDVSETKKKEQKYKRGYLLFHKLIQLLLNEF